MLEFAYAAVHPDYGPTPNPWDLARSSSGSSSGSAVAVATGMGYGSIGSDTGESIRLPAAYCGIVGLKPTYGRVSRHGAIPVSWSADHFGPMTRTAGDGPPSWGQLLEKILGTQLAVAYRSLTTLPSSTARSRESASASASSTCGS